MANHLGFKYEGILLGSPHSWSINGNTIQDRLVRDRYSEHESQ